MDFLRCVVERITYYNDSNGYSVLKVRAKGFNELVAVVGNLAGVTVGSVLALKGEWKNDSKFGRQFAVQSWEERLPATVQGIEKYLGSGLIKGVGPAFAKKIVDHFGEETLTIIEDRPDELLKIEGVGEKRVEMIIQAWKEQKEIKNLMLFLTEHGLSTGHAVRIYKAYGDKSVDTIRENPYRMADDIWGVGFRTADLMADKLGFDKANPARCRSGILYTLNVLSGEGHCFAKRAQLVSTACELLDVETSLIDETLENMVAEYDVIAEETDSIYLPPLYYSEVGAANRLRTIFETICPKVPSGIEGFMDALLEKLKLRSAELSRVEYSDIQEQAIRLSLLSKVLIITGGPGTGKTTTILGIISIMKQFDLNVVLAAPTGRAAKRMSEACGFEAKTIHRLLGYKPHGGYEHDSDNPLKGDVLIVDESSMIDIVLFNSLLKAVPDEMKIVFVGDIDQLPSVGPGNVLADIISCGCFPVIKLNTIFRQAQRSDIVKNAHLINAGKFPSLNNGKQTDFFFVETDNYEDVPSIIVGLCKERLAKFFKADPIHDIQILCPMNRTVSGAANLNTVLQNELNPGARSIKRGGIEYRLGDKVMQVRNDYEKNVFNGDIGVITAVEPDTGDVIVMFDGREVAYELSDLDELVLSYAVTIHKSQGSEYPIVIMPFTMQFYVMLQRNLLYTGITRAKKAIVLVGEKRAIGAAVANAEVKSRNSGLMARLIASQC